MYIYIYIYIYMYISPSGDFNADLVSQTVQELQKHLLLVAAIILYYAIL